MKASELRSQSIDELTATSEELSKEIFELVGELRVTRKLDAPHVLRQKRRARARVKTILREKQEQK